MSNQNAQKTPYNRIVLPGVYGALSVAAPFHRKLKATLAVRKDLRARWLSASERFDDRPVWFHVSSVGEYEQAKPVISKLQETHPDMPVAISFTSPSGYEYAIARETIGNSNNIRFIEYLPFDFVDNARFCIESLNPRLLVFVKFDLWPNLIWEATKAGVPAMLIDATLSVSSHRLSRIGKRFYRAVYQDLKRILAISDGDANRFSECVPEHDGIAVAGDTRFDRVMERKRTNGSDSDIDTRERFVIIAGSTWPRDEEHLLPAIAKLSKKAKQILIVMAPHEPTDRHVAHLLEWMNRQRIEAAPLSRQHTLSKGSSSAQALIVDSVGKLAELYRIGDIAYVGGSFSTGVHSVIEPAIMGIPVLFGPKHRNSFEAIELVRRGAAFEADNAGDIGGRLVELHNDEGLRKAMGRRAREYVESQLGATDRCLESMKAYI
jgi:3-deoxy-D-manno-octulosonic-acid transferase